VPHRTRRVAHLGGISDPPRPEEPVLQGVHVGQRVSGQPVASLLGPILPVFPSLASTRSGRDVSWRRVDTVEPFAAVVDGVGPLAADRNSVVC